MQRKIPQMGGSTLHKQSGFMGKKLKKDFKDQANWNCVLRNATPVLCGNAYK